MHERETKKENNNKTKQQKAFGKKTGSHLHRCLGMTVSGQRVSRKAMCTHVRSGHVYFKKIIKKKISSIHHPKYSYFRNEELGGGGGGVWCFLSPHFHHLCFSARHCRRSEPPGHSPRKSHQQRSLTSLQVWGGNREHRLGERQGVLQASQSLLRQVTPLSKNHTSETTPSARARPQKNQSAITRTKQSGHISSYHAQYIQTSIYSNTTNNLS